MGGVIAPKIPTDTRSRFCSFTYSLPILQKIVSPQKAAQLQPPPLRGVEVEEFVVARKMTKCGRRARAQSSEGIGTHVDACCLERIEATEKYPLGRHSFYSKHEPRSDFAVVRASAAGIDLVAVST